MRVVEIHEGGDLYALRPAWNSLVADCPSATTFVTWEWTSAWWSAYGQDGDLRILAAYDEGGVLRGILPLRRQQVRRHGLSAVVYSFAADGSNDSDYLDAVLAPGFERRVMDAFLAHLAPELAAGAVLELNEIPESSTALASLRERGTRTGTIWTEADVPCGIVELAETWDQYLGILKPRFRTKVRSVLRQLETSPEVTFGICDSVERSLELLPRLFDLHARRWEAEGKPGVFGGAKKRDFYRELSRLLAGCQSLRFSWLAWNRNILACQYGFVHQERYFQLQEGYEPASEHLNVGIGLRAWSIREYIGQGIREYDFMGGVGRHKMDWGASIARSKRIQLARKTSRNLVFCRGAEWSAQAREAVKNLLPARILAAREARLRAGGGATPGSNWKQQTAAHLYVNFGLPALVRPLREKFEANVVRNGAGRAVRLRRRAEGSGRIIYYHRVNDRANPYLPAMTTGLFEQEMRHIARHYKVVSLRELVHRFQEPVQESVVAITFDDGYRDNYEHAFPILQRYGLPATVFLATAGMDSAEPLWFDRLALAFKTTTKDHLDLEVEFPRRFWMRSEQERLSSYESVRHLLRSVGDCDRRRHFAEILAQLGAGAQDELRGQMLTWEQVREMKAGGIDFGGHTVTHPYISKLEPADALWEVSECKRRIEEEIQAPVPYFAYPNGRSEDFSPGCKKILGEAGYEAAVTTLWGLNYLSTDLMELRRGNPWEEDPAVFACKLDWYQLVSG